MSTINVCPLSRLVDTVEKSDARHVVSLINAGMDIPYPLSVPLENRLFLGFNDIVDEIPGLIPPEQKHVEMLLSFVRQWDQVNPLVIHCWMGVSRSTAGAYITQCALMPDADEHELAHRLRAAAPEATPNIRLVGFADTLLERSGRMVEAISSIGRGVDTYEGVPFVLPVR